jgi:hypothetical protein
MQPSTSINSSHGGVREERCIVLCMCHPEGVTPEQGYALRDLLNRVETSGWWFLNPGTFVVAFSCSRSGAARAVACQDALRELVAADQSFASIGVGVAEGGVIGSFSSAGILESLPIGGVVSEAMKNAIENAS